MSNSTNINSKLKPPSLLVVRRATLAACREKSNNLGKVGGKKASTVNDKQERVLKRQNSNLENQEPLTKKVKRKEYAQEGKKKAVAPKRAPWDYKGRMEDMEQYLGTLKSTQQESIQRIEMLESQKHQLQGNVVMKEKEMEEATALSKKLQKRLNEKTEVEEELRGEIERVSSEKDLIDREREEFKFELELSQNEVKTLKLKMSTLSSELLGVNTELDASKDAYKKAKMENDRQASVILQLESKIREHQDSICELEARLRGEETLRRQLHNKVQELKGNIRVYCRVRPSLPSETSVSLTNMEFTNDTDIILHNNSKSSASSNKSQQARMSFSFDKAFCPETTQGTVYQEISQLVQSVLDGYNVCIFAYGQTGSGKTFTMEGDINGRETWGMIPRAMEQVFFSAEELTSKGWKYEIQASFLEIYNETIRDLLGNPDSKHEIKQVTTNNGKQANDVFVTNLKTVAVTSSDQVSSLLRKAYENRSVAATNCNDRSSRSHSVFQLKLLGSNEITGEQSQGLLSLVDLAGSERISQSGSTGLRLKEAQNINKSLTNLGIVFNSLANKDSHVPYRNSKLTYLLQNSLGGNSKSLMFVNVSPREDSFQETLCSLRFATQVNNCNIGTAQKVKK
ncbi:carboxy-terminal kinesin 2-like isoform X1 [Xenia sp. Carnegie-2017]|uniref:carboxy-terminal kinesin 2-like isoform X1 n=1 Tax=Xenia sp. Carnegie-2017 TaxID=2897299 RepID=UPI001F046E2A|nr:carboxy-terminal kinesin 2-like isoform X1 [Xenia sp. Carnegie-2017]XP_046861737.1 carboxy-terminal kinesin 2-like isoform X1 [Xenia sp. Carnegie-2017]